MSILSRVEAYSSGRDEWNVIRSLLAVVKEMSENNTLDGSGDTSCLYSCGKPT
jgi:hypothetical protein